MTPRPRDPDPEIIIMHFLSGVINFFRGHQLFFGVINFFFISP